MKKIRYIGTKKFYKMVMAIALPIMIQNGITNLVSMIDNIMIGQIGTNEMSGVAIINQLIFVFNLCVFGGMAGAGIFTAQFFGKDDQEGIRHTFRFKIWVGLLLVLIGTGIFIFLGSPIISLYLHTAEATNDLTLTFDYAKTYLTIMLIGLIPFTLKEVYSSTLRETGETVMPMKAGICAVVTNLFLNWVLIFGKLGAPALGVAGAAIATVISRFVELFVLAVWTHLHKGTNQYIVGIYSSLKVPKQLSKDICIKGMPLLFNEALWSGGTAVRMQCYSLKGLTVIAGLNIASTLSNVFNVAFIALGSSVGIIIGQLLGAKKMQRARYTVEKLIFFSVTLCMGLGIIMFIIAPLFPKIYNTTPEVKELAKYIIMIYAFYMPIWAFTNSTYFTLRSGGKTMLTFAFDSGFMWLLELPTVFLLTRFTNLNILLIIAIAQSFDIIKSIIGYFLVKKGIWVNNIVNEEISDDI